MKSLSATVHMKSAEQYFVVLFINIFLQKKILIIFSRFKL